MCVLNEIVNAFLLGGGGIPQLCNVKKYNGYDGILKIRKSQFCLVYIDWALHIWITEIFNYMYRNTMLGK